MFSPPVVGLFWNPCHYLSSICVRHYREFVIDGTIRMILRIRAIFRATYKCVLIYGLRCILLSLGIL